MGDDIRLGQAQSRLSVAGKQKNDVVGHRIIRKRVLEPVQGDSSAGVEARYFVAKILRNGKR